MKSYPQEMPTHVYLVSPVRVKEILARLGDLEGCMDAIQRPWR